MSIFDKFFLRLFLLGVPIYKRMKVNPSHLEAILVAKLTMDNRRPTGFQQMKQNKEKKEVNRATLGTMVFGLIMGLLFLVSFAIGNDLTTKLTIFFSMFIFILAATLITDFTSVLIDIRDNQIILPKPVNDATFVLSRLIHIAIHISKIALPLCLPSIIAVIVVAGWWAVVPFSLMVFMTTLLSIFLINAVYILILKITTPSKFQSVISYFQILFMIVIYASYQLLPRLIDKSVTKNLRMAEISHIRFYPPFWFAEASDSLTSFSFGVMQLVSIALSVLIPLVSIVLVVKYFAPAFNQKLSMINSTATENNVKIAGKSALKKSRVEMLASLLTSKGSEYMGFLFTWKMMSRSRDFKMKVYPSFGYIIVLLVMMMIGRDAVSLTDFNEMNNNGKRAFLMIVYFACFIVLAAITQVTYSDKFKGAWLFHITPLEQPGKVISGAFKSIIVHFYLPIILLVGGVSIIMIGVKIIPNLLFGSLNVLAICSVLAYFNMQKFPFSISQNIAKQGSTAIRMILVFLIPASIGIFQWLIFDYIWMVVFVALLSATFSWMMIDSLKKISWEKVGRYN